MDTYSEYYNVYSKEPDTKVFIYAPILYFVIVINESMVDIQLIIGYYSFHAYYEDGRRQLVKVNAEHIENEIAKMDAVQVV